jgi:dihydropteroate synthase
MGRSDANTSPMNRASGAPSVSGAADSSDVSGVWGQWGKRTYVMGVVNVTPDSFSGDGQVSAEAAVAQGVRQVAEGADVLDIGGESTRPGAQPVPPAIQIERVVPVIARLSAKVGVPISIDTSSAEVAEAALALGATIVNDVRGLEGDPSLAAVVARHGACVVLVHGRGGLNPPPVPLAGASPEDWLRWELAAADAIGEALERHVSLAREAGIARQRIIIDPGVGFGKQTARTLALLRHLGRLRERPTLKGLPILVGPSRKGFIGDVLGLPVHERLEGTLAVLALSIAQEADMVRVHDVREAVRCCRMADTIVRGGRRTVAPGWR